MCNRRFRTRIFSPVGEQLLCGLLGETERRSYTHTCGGNVLLYYTRQGRKLKVRRESSRARADFARAYI